ncbi:hypothetical protein OBBRIDRAFT_729811 [Obba rivulosa]|uniref:histone acetyltransferase n=1 Tax=Obba rivulosa TaxID=1052685 RepID=A0A8E2DJY5_9APHY|nr:hypothetical protein OBBRIDRAFT_729811 [Obba rivulosa]
MSTQLDSTFGAALVGLVVGAILYGITLLQTYEYFRRYPHDSKFVKSLVRHLDTEYLVTNFANFDNLDEVTWSMALQTDCNGLIGLIVECLYLVSQNWLITSIIVILSCIHFCTRTLAPALCRSSHSGSFSPPPLRLCSPGCRCASAADVLIAGAMCWSLYTKRTGIARINTGLLTSILALTVIITFSIMPVNFVWLSFFWIMGKCYVNSFLALLNSRENLREKASRVAVGMSRLRTGRSFPSIQVPGSASPRPNDQNSFIMAKKLRDHLLTSLASLPGTREFHIHVLVSSPRKHTGLFPYAHPRPRAYLQDILILLSEQTTPESPRVLVSAIEASLYSIPATSCGVLYVSKVDSSGHSSAPSPTATLVRGFLSYYGDPTTRPITVKHLWIQLFARAQGQYLFPNSSEFSGKRPLADVKLCAWWKRTLSQVAQELRVGTKGTSTLRLYYILPGYNELEAVHVLGGLHTLPAPGHADEVGWIYGHHYSQNDIPLPCPTDKREGVSVNLGHYIPWFDDDPKSRFIDEIAHTANVDGVRSPKQKRPRPIHGKTEDRARKEVPRDEDEEGKDNQPAGELGKVTADEFWERMSFRQECIAGAVTGFFALGVSSPTHAADASGPVESSLPSPLAPQPGQVPPRMVRRIVATLLNHHDFSTTERAVRATETLEGAIKGLCEDLAPASAPSVKRAADRYTTPEPEASGDTFEVPCTPPPRGRALLPDISPNPFPEPVASLETYNSHIYGSISVRNAPLVPKGDGSAGTSSDAVNPVRPVTVLAARKKRKAAS